MKTITPAMQTMLDAATASEINLATLMVVTRADGAVYRFCAYDKDITYDGEVYERALGYSKSDIQTSDALDVDNLNMSGALNSESITDDDLRAGEWDLAEFNLFMVNPLDPDAFGPIKLRRGWLGEVTTTRGAFEAELRGLMQALSKIIGRIYSPACDATLGDERCKVDLSGGTSEGAFTDVGTVESISADGLVILDSARTEPGPSGPVSISGITQDDPGVVTTAAAHGFIEGQMIMHGDIGGMTAANGPQVVRNPTAMTYEIVNTEDFDAYTSGGEASPFVDSGWWDFGVLTMTSGANDGRSMDVKSYVPGVISLQLPFDEPIEVGDTYEIVVGCDKTLATCIGKFDNVVNNRSFPHLRGNDALVQVGRHT